MAFQDDFSGDGTILGTKCKESSSRNSKTFPRRSSRSRGMLRTPHSNRDGFSVLQLHVRSASALLTVSTTVRNSLQTPINRPHTNRQNISSRMRLTSNENVRGKVFLTETASFVRLIGLQQETARVKIFTSGKQTQSAGQNPEKAAHHSLKTEAKSKGRSY
jgi:hypothetical protein